MFADDFRVVSWFHLFSELYRNHRLFERILPMAKTQRKLKKANHGRRPASSKARKAKRKKFKL